MFISELINEAFSAITMNKTRSGLTVLGIVIGIGSVIAMISVGQGAQGSITEKIEAIGSNLIIIYPGAQKTSGTRVSSGFGSAQTLTQEDADAIQEQITSIKAISPEISRRYQIVFGDNNTNTSVVGAVPAYSSVRNYEVDSGVFISDQNVSAASKVAVIGPTTRDDLFGEGADAIGETIKINKVKFTVIGITKSKGTSGSSDSDDIIIVPITAAQKFLQKDTYLSSISIQAQDQDSMTQIQEDATSLLLSRHKISDSANADFRVLNQTDLVSTATSMTSTFTMLLASIASISLVVGGIGIMNMMLTTVTERTREIGLRKAIGAKSRYINNQFLLESVMLTFIGGVVGIALGWACSFLITQFANITTSVSLWSILLAFGVSAAIGIVFGYYPARRAASLNPIEALRYE